MIRVVVTGSECTGKTTLAGALAGAYDTDWVPEFARRFVRDKGAPPTYDDVAAIARGQMRLEDERWTAAATASLLVQDTDLLSSIVYSRHYYGVCPAWIEETFPRRAADLYLLADIDVPWIAVAGQRDRGDRREEMQTLFRDALVGRGLTFADVGGTLDERVRIAATVIGEHRRRNGSVVD